MKKMINLAYAAIAVLTFAACAQEDWVEKPNVTGEGNSKLAMGFSAKVPNMTRAENATLPYRMNDNFGVFTTMTKKVSGTTSSIVEMDNYKVLFSTTQPSTGGETWGTTTESDKMNDGKSYWYYDGIGSQTIKYWDTDADSYKFVAYTPYIAYDESNPTQNSVVKKLKDATKFNSAATEVEPNFMQASHERTKSVTGGVTIPVSTADVPFAFKHVNSKIQLSFYEGLAGYSVQITKIQFSGTDINQETDVTVALTGYSVSSKKVKDLAAIDFACPTGNIETSSPGSESATIYYCMPAATAAEVAADATGQLKTNGVITVYVEYTTTDTSTGATANRSGTATVPVDYTQWGQNYFYKYIFRIGNDLKPIVFDSISVEEYQTPSATTSGPFDLN